MNSARGNARATYLSRGIKLPPRDSLEDRIMRAMLERERDEKIATLQANLLGQAVLMGGDRHKMAVLIEPVIDAYRSEVYQRNYNLQHLQARLMERLKGTKDDVDLVKLVDSWRVP